jgi:cation transport ATPase
VEDAQFPTGKGASGMIGGQRILLGTAGFWRKTGWMLCRRALAQQQLRQDGAGVVLVAAGGRWRA